MDIVEQAKAYLAQNAAESGADALIRELIAEVESLRSQFFGGVAEVLKKATDTNQIVREANERLDRAGIPR